eukprot:CAMPEP_0198229094 /NCGR_PEP_ID=MMETSP1445-20131203/113943_1 /TAXON_ID=36898 /ORGANISM="Pyramimonas sp., Strain CCMP2087" /LENGTH=141 /DNA_ID=CAMNT_0043909537 /DNA_START=327 /DNA_END=751 /DNA_ORIENTATION=-
MGKPAVGAASNASARVPALGLSEPEPATASTTSTTSTSSLTFIMAEPAVGARADPLLEVVADASARVPALGLSEPEPATASATSSTNNLAIMGKPAVGARAYPLLEVVAHASALGRSALLAPVVLAVVSDQIVKRHVKSSF